MPLYEFDCPDCSKRFEVIIPYSRLADVVCPSCSGARVRKCVSGFGIGGGGSRIRNAGKGCEGCTSTNCGTCGQ